MRRIYDDANRRDYGRRPRDDFGALLDAADEIALAAGNSLKVPPSRLFVRPVREHGKLTFDPFARLDPSQVQDLSHDERFLRKLVGMGPFSNMERVRRGLRPSYPPFPGDRGA